MSLRRISKIQKVAVKAKKESGAESESSRTLGNPIYGAGHRQVSCADELD
jgi:hypothetical protein